MNHVLFFAAVRKLSSRVSRIRSLLIMEGVPSSNGGCTTGADRDVELGKINARVIT